MMQENKKLKYHDSVLTAMTVEEAKKKQFHIVDVISRHFTGSEMFETGDLGVNPRLKRPERTAKVEKVLADIFHAEDAALVRGSGTGGIRSLLSVLLEPGESIFVHTAPIYTTTKETFRMLGLHPLVLDYNQPREIEKQIKSRSQCKVFYIQHARQQPTDTYDVSQVIRKVKQERPDIQVVVDDNYCAFKMRNIGVESGADYSTFSGFKVLGPEGVGIVLGNKAAIGTIHQRNYSGGSQVQGFEAMDLLRSIPLAPVSLAIQNEQVERLCALLNEGNVEGIQQAYITNSQSKNVIVELENPVAKDVIAASEAFGAATYPVGAESRYEVLPMIYRVSGSFLESRPDLEQYGLRINPMKSGAETVAGILQKTLQKVLQNQNSH